MILVYILAAVLVVSIVSLVGIITLSLKKGFLQKFLALTICFAAGAMLGATFFDLLPEALEYQIKDPFLYVLIGIIFFFASERLIFWHHHHQGKKEIHSFTYMNLFGDALHNFVDGVVIAASFLHSMNLGLVTTLAIVFHEIPQEIGDFGILIYGGFTKFKALFFNFLTALTSVIGALASYFFFSAVNNFTPFLMLFAAGGFIYIAGTDLFPEIKKERDYKAGLKQLVAIIIGMYVIWWVSRIQLV